jgi:DNA-binding transcriptional LysR family regulator
MRFELRHLRAFVLLAEELHFRRAAERLCMTQPALSRTIRTLEEDVGVELLLRTTRSVELTEAGRVFLTECREVLRLLERGVMRTHSAALGNAGNIAVAYTDFAINGPLPQILETFRRQHPGVRVELSYIPTVVQKEEILTGHIDVGLLIGPFESKGIHSVSVMMDPLVALLPDSHPLARQEAIALEDLADEPFVLGSKDSWAAFRHIVFVVCREAGFTPNVVQEASTSDGIFGLVSANIGVSLYPSCVRSIQRQGLTIRPLLGVEHQVETLAVWRSDSDSPSVERFVTTLRETIRHLREPGAAV